jgi:very-short-patch-repair endonuclease
MEEKKLIKCEVCGKEFNFLNTSHLRMHGLSKQDYIDLYPNADHIFGWSKGLTKETSESLKTVSQKVTKTLKNLYKSGELVNWNAGTKGVCKAWNKDLTKKTDERVKLNTEHSQKTLKERFSNGEIISWNKGLTKETHSGIAAGAESKKGDKNPAKRKEVREVISSTLIKTYEDHPEILINRKPSGINQYSTSFTYIENVVKDILEKLCINYLHNYKVDRYFPDFFLPDYNIIIECDGEHWHSSPEAKLKDQIKTECFENLGFKVLRFTGKEINQETQKVIFKIEESINHKQACGLETKELLPELKAILIK